MPLKNKVSKPAMHSQKELPEVMRAQCLLQTPNYSVGINAALGHFKRLFHFKMTSLSLTTLKLSPHY